MLKKRPESAAKVDVVALFIRRERGKDATRIEALVFGIPCPLKPGWPSRYAAMEITDAMSEVWARVAVAKESTANRARRRLERVYKIVATASLCRAVNWIDWRR